MNVTSVINNTSAIYYHASQKVKEELANVAKSSPKKPTDGKETTKNWVLQSFFPKSHQMERKSTKAADNNSATVASNPEPSASASGDDKATSTLKQIDHLISMTAFLNDAEVKGRTPQFIGFLRRFTCFIRALRARHLRSTLFIMHFRATCFITRLRAQNLIAYEIQYIKVRLDYIYEERQIYGERKKISFQASNQGPSSSSSPSIDPRAVSCLYVEESELVGTDNIRNELLQIRKKIPGHKAHLIGKLANVAKSSPKKPTDGKETTKSWVLQSFYPSSKAADNNSTTVASNPKPSGSASGDKANPPAKKKIANHKGEPTVRFDQSLINSHGEKLKFCVVGKFPGSRPSLAQIRKWVAKEWKLKGDCSITLLDPHHIFVRLESQDDMIYVWSRNRWLINGRHLMKVFRWSTKFRPAAGEPSLAAVWISLPLLPVVFFQEELLSSVASVVGRVLAMDGPTRNLTRTDVARVCLEVDLLKELPRRVRIEIGDEGFWQYIYYEKLPSFCTVCQQQGHSIEICKFNKKDSVEKVGNLNSNSSLPNPNSKIKNGRCSEVLVTEVKHTKFVIGDKTENGQAVTESSCHLPLNGCSLEESSKMKKMDATDSRGECSDVVTTEQSLTANGPSKLSANQVAVLEKTDDLLKAGTSKVVQDEKLQGENTLLQVEEEVEEEEEEEEEEGKCDDDGDLVHIETKRQMCMPMERHC